MKINRDEANQVTAEVVMLFEREGVKLPKGFDFDHLVDLLHEKNERRFSHHDQEWISQDSPWYQP